MTNKISYGPHLFPGGPINYIRKGNIGLEEANERIRQTLECAFSSDNKEGILLQLSKNMGFDVNQSVNLSFMNYGNTELVYLASLANGLKFATLINQPHTPLGVVREEFDNLTQLVEIDSRFIVKPFAHFRLTEKDHEVYVSEYIENAMCVAIHRGHGVYDPLPYYHFESFSPALSKSVNSSMIALFVNYFDIKRKKGIAKTQICGNDFILTREFREDEPKTVLPNIKIISARGLIDVQFEEYLDILRSEFLIETERTDPEVISGEVRVNHHSRRAMTSEEIEEGIRAGLELREQHK